MRAQWSFDLPGDQPAGETERWSKGQWGVIDGTVTWQSRETDLGITVAENRQRTLSHGEGTARYTQGMSVVGTVSFG